MKTTASLGAAIMLAACGCGGGEAEPAQSVPIDQVPPKLMQIAREKLPGITFDRAYKIDVKGKDAYEIRGKDSRGKIREVEVSTTGEILEVE
jgi:hypothetical protein